GTVLCSTKARISFQPNLSSSHFRNPLAMSISGVPRAANVNLIALQHHVVALERPGRGATDVAAIHRIQSAMARTPDVAEVAAILHRATQVCADGRHGVVLAIGSQNEQRGTAPKPKDSSRIRLQVPYAPCQHVVGGELNRFRRNDVAQDRIEKGGQRCKNSGSKKHFKKPTSFGAGLHTYRFVVQSPSFLTW